MTCLLTRSAGGTALVEVVKITEAMYNGGDPVDASVTFGGFLLLPAVGGTIRVSLPPAPPANAPRLEFIGDSITAGMGAVGDNAAAGTCNSGGDVSGMHAYYTWTLH